jgi:hypothetical protein
MINCTGYKGHQQGFRKHVKEADDAADYIAGVTPLTRAAFQKRKALVEPALTCYIADLKKSKNALREKVCNAIPNLEYVDREIQVAEFCKQSLL